MDNTKMKNKFYTFEDLEFEPHPNFFFGGDIAKLFFSNGYGVSVLIGGHGYDEGSTPYELAVLEGNVDNWDLCYSTPITDDVLGYLTPEEVTDYMIEVQKLERAKNEL
jgi:hypothetical protein